MPFLGNNYGKQCPQGGHSRHSKSSRCLGKMIGLFPSSGGGEVSGVDREEQAVGGGLF